MPPEVDLNCQMTNKNSITLEYLVQGDLHIAIEDGTYEEGMWSR